MLEFRINKYF